MTAATEYAASVPAVVEHRPWWRNRVTWTGTIVAAMIVAYFSAKGTYPWPHDTLVWNKLPHYLDRFQIWLSDHRDAPHPSVVFRAFNGIATFLDNLVTWLYDLLTKMTWVGTTVTVMLVVLRFGGVRAAAIILTAFASFGALGFWDESMQTLALMLAAVVLSLAVGMPLGVIAGRSHRFNRVITPVLDAMQIVPAFAYLMPVVILFSVGPGAAVVTTMIYAVPPAIRITALGIRGVPPNTVEAAQAMGSTRRQLLGKVQLPLARRMLLLSVNQTILFALSMVVIAGLIGGQGLGDVVTGGLNSDAAKALLAGVAIVIMAMTLDRATEAIAERTDPARRHLRSDQMRRLKLATLAAAVTAGATIGIAHALGGGEIYSRWTAQDWLRAQVQKGLDYVQSPTTFVFHITEPIGNFIVRYGLVPLGDFFKLTPWYVMLVGLSAIAFVVSGRRAAITAAAMFGSIGLLGQWEQAMDTFSQVLVATALAVAIGIALGVWAAESKRVSRVLRPINDVLQTLPQLVYIIPFIYLMPVSVVPGIIAAVLYATPVVVRLVETGIREVPTNTVEAAASFGATRRQILMKVKLPLAQNAVMLGVNQGIVMVLAVVVIGGLVGSGGLGYEVAYGLQQGQFGVGVVASLAILALGIALDRVTQSQRGARSEGRQ